jgi:hypothetical protein
MDTDKMTMIKKVTNYHLLFRSELVCSSTTDEHIHLIRDRFGYNSEKQFNNPRCLKRAATKGDGSSEQFQGS